MKTLKHIFAGFLITVLTTTGCFGISDNCRYTWYRQNHRKECQEIKSISGTTVMAIVGGAVLAGTGFILANKSSDDGSSFPNDNQTIFPRSANVISNYSLTDKVQNNKIYTDYMNSATHGSDISAQTIESIRNSANYIRNQKQFDAINLAWANARGFTGKNVSVNVMDDFETYHGHAVHDIVNYIAPDTIITDKKLTTAPETFVSFNAIANIMKNSEPADIYNNSWQIQSAQNQNAATVVYNNFDTKTYANAQQYMYSWTSQNFITQIINLSADNDSIFVWAAGNDSATESGILSAMPLAFPELQGHFVNVVATNATGTRLASYSNQCGITQNYCIAAPGSSIQTDSDTSKVYGTSFATPIVSGAIAVIKEAFPYMTSAEITALLFTTAKDLGEPGVDSVYGWGLLDMESATKPVGTPKIVLSNDNIIPLTTSNVGGLAGAAIKNAGIKLAFIDDFGRAFTTNLSDNINVIPYGRAFDKLTESDNNSMTLFNNFEFGFKNTNILESNGLLSTQAKNTTKFIGYKNEFNIDNINIYYQTRFGVSHPASDTNSIISGFSDVHTASIKTGIAYQDFSFEFAIPETILYGNAYMNLPVARANNGQIIYNNYTINLTTRPSFEYSIKYKNITAGYINNTDYQDEFFIMAKTKFAF